MSPVILGAIHAHPVTKIWGDGDTSSSDGPFFRAGGHGGARADYNVKYGSEPGVKFYTHVSDRCAPFYSKVIAANASEAAHRRRRRDRSRVRPLPPFWIFASRRASAISPTANSISWTRAPTRRLLP